MTGTIDRDLRRLIYETLIKAGFPDMKKSKVRAGEVPASLQMFQDRDEGTVTLTKKLTQRTVAYHEILEILRAIAAEFDFVRQTS